MGRVHQCDASPHRLAPEFPVANVIDGPPSEWDVEWFYHLPFPMLSVEWFDVCHFQEIPVHRLPVRTETIDHSDWIEELLLGIGLDFRKGTNIIRIFGYSPRSTDLFDE